MAFTVTVNYKNETFTSEPIDDVTLEDGYELAETIADGKVSNFSIINGRHKYYFSEKVLQESVITITKINNK